MSGAFDAALPPPYSGEWKQAERASPEDSPRLTSYQAPGGEAIQFVLKSFEFSGGQSIDTAEYPFGGLWTNEALNEKPQQLHINGFIRGAEYIQTRNALIEALRITTGDSEPGYIDFPFWGRFPIVVLDYKVSETIDEKGQCALTLVFKRAGASIAERAASVSSIAGSQSGMGAALETAAEDLEAAAIDSFEKALAGNAEAAGNFEAGTARAFSQGAAQIKTALLSALGRIQAAQAKLNAVSAEINGIFSLAAELIGAPRQLAQSLFNAAASIVAGLAEISNSAAAYLPKNGAASGPSYQAPVQNAGQSAAPNMPAGNPASNPPGQAGNQNSGQSNGQNAASYKPKSNAVSKASSPSYPAPAANNEQNVLLQFLSASSFALSSIPLTVRQEAAQRAVENLYRICAFSAAGIILAQLEAPFQKTEGYWKLFIKLEESIDKNDPAVYAALETVRVYVSCILSAKELSAEKRRLFNAPLPLLCLAQCLGCGEDKLRELNRIADSFAVRGNVLYV